MNELACNEFVELVTAHLDGALDSGTERRFVDHLGACDGCTAYLDQIRETIDALGTLTPGTLPPGALPAPAREALLRAFRDRPPPAV